jgi:autotransporter-associated beta strand protein
VGGTVSGAGVGTATATATIGAVAGGGLTKTGTGTLYLNAANTYSGITTISNGTVALGANGSIANSSVISVNSGATFDVQALSNVNFTLGASQTLKGNGTVQGTAIINGTLAPGSDGIGTLTINGNLTLNAGSTNLFEVNGTTLAKDVIVAGGVVNYGGVLQIAPTGTFTNGQQFVLFSGTGATNTGNFASLVSSAGTGLKFAFTNGVLSVVTVGPSGPASITNSMSGGILSLSWPAGQGWRLQMQTNSLSTGLGTNWIYLTDGNISSTNITSNPTIPTVFYRLKYP